MAAANGTSAKTQETQINPLVASIPMAKTMALTDLANSLKEKGKDVVALAAGEPDFDTPEPVSEAGIAAIRSASLVKHIFIGNHNFTCKLRILNYDLSTACSDIRP